MRATKARARRTAESKLAQAIAQLIAQHLTLDLPVRGQWYRISCPPYNKVAPIAAVLLVAGDPPPGATPEQFVLDAKAADSALEVLLGENYGQMLLDGVPPHLIEHAAETVLVWMVRGMDRAILHWSRHNPDAGAAAFVKLATEG